MGLRVLMLGWEFPPFITGGLGTACYGLTRAMERTGLEVTFVLPKSIDPSHASHVRLVSPGNELPVDAGVPTVRSHAPTAGIPDMPATVAATEPATAHEATGVSVGTPHTRFLRIPITVPSVYDGVRHDEMTRLVHSASIHRFLRPGLGAADADAMLRELAVYDAVPEAGPPTWSPSESGQRVEVPRPSAVDYGGDLIGQTERYARFCVDACRRHSFDVIHAHDWLTYPAGLALARLTGKPLVVHVHSTEFDRSGEHVNQPVYNIERRGMHGSARVIAVSQLTKNLCVNRYGVSADKIDVVYNGVEFNPRQKGLEGIRTDEKIVLYFGRITMQKGPEYFIAAARRVLEVMDDVKFVVAGSGDQAQRMIEMAAEAGIGSKVLFTGFLRGRDIERVFSMADLYVMPSVSEPFGIAPLEAMSHRVPVLISRTSGVSEILVHALKCDFWDVNDMANKIVAVLRHPPLQRTLREKGLFEVREITWEGAAKKCESTYRRAVATVGRPTPN